MSLSYYEIFPVCESESMQTALLICLGFHYGSYLSKSHLTLICFIEKF